MPHGFRPLRASAIPLGTIDIDGFVCALWADTSAWVHDHRWFHAPTLFGTRLGPPPLDELRCVTAYRAWSEGSPPPESISALAMVSDGPWSPWARPVLTSSSSWWFQVYDASMAVADEVRQAQAVGAPHRLATEWARRPWLALCPNLHQALWPGPTVATTDPVDLGWAVSRLLGDAAIKGWGGQGNRGEARRQPDDLDLFRVLRDHPQLVGDDPKDQVDVHDIVRFVHLVHTPPNDRAEEAARLDDTAFVERRLRALRARERRESVPGQPSEFVIPDLHMATHPCPEDGDRLAGYRATVGWLRTGRALRMVEALGHGSFDRVRLINAGTTVSAAEFATLVEHPYRKLSARVGRRHPGRPHVRAIATGRAAAEERVHYGAVRAERRPGWEAVAWRDEDGPRADDEIAVHAEGFVTDWRELERLIPGFEEAGADQRWEVA